MMSHGIKAPPGYLGLGISKRGGGGGWGRRVVGSQTLPGISIDVPDVEHVKCVGRSRVVERGCRQ